MKPNVNQSKVIDSVISIIKTWESTNDISSPTHLGDIAEYLKADLDDVVSETKLDELEVCLAHLWSAVRFVK